MNGNVKRLEVANGPNIFQMLLVLLIGNELRFNISNGLRRGVTLFPSRHLASSEENAGGEVGGLIDASPCRSPHR